MRKHIKYIFAVALFAVTAIACGEDKGVEVTSVSLNPTSLTLEEGASEKLTAQVEPKDAINQKLTWDSNNKAAATVDASGNVTAVKTGTATITATVVNGKKGAATVAVTAAPPLSAPSITVTSTGLGNLKVGQAVSGASIVYTLTNGTYAASVTAANFAVSGLPAGLTTATTVTRTNNTVAVSITGTPTTVKTSATPITRPATIPASQLNPAPAAAVAVSGSLSASAVAKGDGASVTTPAVSGTPTSNSITVGAVTVSTTPRNTGQSAQYAITTNSSSTMPTGLTWQSGTTFSSLNSGTPHYVWARSAENPNNNAGTAVRSAAISTAAGKTVTFATTTQTVTQGAIASYEINTTGGIAAFSASSTQWYSNAEGTLTTSAPANVFNYALVWTGVRVTKKIGTNDGGITPAGTYYFRVTIEGVQSSNVATLIVTAPVPTSISFGSTTTYYTYPGMEFPVNYTLTPSGADAGKITWTQSSTNPYIKAEVGSVTNTSASVRITCSGGAEAGRFAEFKSTVTLTGALPNSANASVTINTRFVVVQTHLSDFSGSYDHQFNDYTSYTFRNTSATTRTIYLRAYYPSNATEWARSEMSAILVGGGDERLTRISTNNYTITSSSADVTVTKADNTYQLTRSSTAGNRTVNLTIRVGSGTTAQTYTKVLNLVDN